MRHCCNRVRPAPSHGHGRSARLLQRLWRLQRNRCVLVGPSAVTAGSHARRLGYGAVPCGGGLRSRHRRRCGGHHHHWLRWWWRRGGWCSGEAAQFRGRRWRFRWRRPRGHRSSSDARLRRRRLGRRRGAHVSTDGARCRAFLRSGEGGCCRRGWRATAIRWGWRWRWRWWRRRRRRRRHRSRSWGNHGGAARTVADVVPSDEAYLAKVSRRRAAAAERDMRRRYALSVGHRETRDSGSGRGASQEPGVGLVWGGALYCGATCDLRSNTTSRCNLRGVIFPVQLSSN
jgi:hypothetical protein